MGDTESDEHLRIFKCLIDTGSLVLRNAIQINVLNKNSIKFDQYLETNKHQFYHQFEKNTRRKCCDGHPHGCVVYGFMDRKIFYKLYNKNTEKNTRYCLDRFEIKADISLDILDLSDLNFLLWNSRTLDANEENALKKIMSIRSAICHLSSSNFNSKDELEGYWSDLKSAVLLLAKPNYFKDSVKMQIETFQNCKLNALESGKIVRAISQILPDITNGFKNCTRNAKKVAKKVKKLGNKLKENHKKDGRRTRNCIQQTLTELQKEGIKTRRQSARIQNTLDKRLKVVIGNGKKVCQKLDCNKRCLNKISDQVNKERNKSSKRFKSTTKQIAEIQKKDGRRTRNCKKQTVTELRKEGIKTRRQSARIQNTLNKRLKENYKKDGQRTRNGIKQTVTELQKEGIKTRRQSTRIQNALENRLKGNRKKVCQKLDSNKICLNKISEQVNEESSKSSKRFESMSKQIADINSQLIYQNQELQELEKKFLQLLTRSQDDGKLILKLDEALDNQLKKEARERRKNHDKFLTDVQEDVNITSKLDQTLSNRLQKIAILKKIGENLDKANKKIKMLTRGKEIAATVVLCGAISGGYTMCIVGGVTTVGLLFWKLYFEDKAVIKAHESMEKVEMTESPFVLKFLTDIPNDILTFQYTVTDIIRRLFISESVSIRFAKEQISKLQEKLENEEEQMQQSEKKKRTEAVIIGKNKYTVDK